MVLLIKPSSVVRRNSLKYELSSADRIGILADGFILVQKKKKKKSLQAAILEFIKKESRRVPLLTTLLFAY